MTAIGPATRLEDREAVVRRFEARVDTALEHAPPSKAWTRAALERRGASRCPVHLRELSYDIILRHGDVLADLLADHPDDLIFVDPYEWAIGYQPPGTADPIHPLQALTEELTWVDEWGTPWGHAAGGVGATPVGHPIDDWAQLDRYLATRLPDARAAGRLDAALPPLRLHGPSRFCAGNLSGGLFERLHFVRGMEGALEGLYTAPRETARLLDAITDYQVELIRTWGGMPHLDACLLTDDWGTQQALMISPTMWRAVFSGRYRRLCDEAHARGLLVIFHSCGNILEIIGDLVDAGVDVIDPLQPEAMDLALVARQFGGSVAFCGGISDQRLGSQTPTQVRDEVRRLIDLLGAPFANAYVLAPANSLMPEIPVDNLVALFEACHGQ
jgi:uroporphyrinogen decarboxylase